MKEKIIIGSSGVVLLLTLLSFGYNILEEDTHFCEAREISYHCDSLGKYYGLPNGKCINNLKSDKLCSSGWIEIDRQIDKQPDNNKRESWKCNQKECILE